MPAPDPQRRTLIVLSAAQILGGIGVGANVAAGGLIAADIAGTQSVAGLATTTSVLGAAIAAVPLAAVTSGRGRRYGLTAGLAVGALGAVVVVLGAALGWVPAVLLGTLLTGAATASGLQARYAATDLAEPGRMAGALSIVVWATTIGAVLGPNLVQPGTRLGTAIGVPALAGAYVISAAAFGAAAGVVWVRLRPDPLLLARARAGVPQGSTTVPLRERVRSGWHAVRPSSNARLGLAAVSLSHAAMVAVMVMTPVHMAHADVSITIIGIVISGHILGMYAFSPVVGWASDRVGQHVVIMVGAGLLLAAAAVSGLAPADHPGAVGAGLFLLGLGWSACLVAGSALLTTSVPADARQDVQGLGDLAMNTCGALAGAAAGGVVALLSFGWLSLLAGLIVLPLAVAARAARPAAVPTG